MKKKIYVGTYDPLDTATNEIFINTIHQGNNLNKNVFKNYTMRDKSRDIIGHLAISEQCFKFGDDPKTYTTTLMNLDVNLNKKHIVVNAQAQNYLIRDDINQNVNEKVTLTYPITSQNENTNYYYIETIILNSSNPRKVNLLCK